MAAVRTVTAVTMIIVTMITVIVTTVGAVPTVSAVSSVRGHAGNLALFRRVGRGTAATFGAPPGRAHPKYQTIPSA
jgi:hypothetical protein